MAKIDKLVENYFSPPRKISFDMLYEMVIDGLGEQVGTPGKGTDLEQAIVDEWNGQTPKHFQGFVKLAVAHLKGEGYGLSGQAGKLEKAPVSEFWNQSGGKDTTSKADITLGDKRVSMKMGPNAMLFGFGPGDAKATMAAAIMTAGLPSEKTAAAQSLRDTLGSMERAIGRAPLGVLKKVRDAAETLPDDADEALKLVGGKGYQMDKGARQKFAQRLGRQKQAAAEEGEEFDRLAAQKLEMVGITTTRQLLEHANEILNLEETLQNIENEVVNALNPTENPELEFAFYKEALTGAIKFGGLNPATKQVRNPSSPNIADSIYITQPKEVLIKYTGKANIKGLHVFHDLDDSYIRKISSAASWRGKFRSDSLKEKIGGKNKKTGYNLLRSSIIAEIKIAKGEKNAYLAEWDKMLQDNLSQAVSEGLLTEQELNEAGLGDFIRKAAEVGKTVIKKGAEFWAGFMKSLKKFINKFTKWFQDTIMSIAEQAKKLVNEIKDAMQGGTHGLMQFFGISLSDYVEMIDPPADPGAAILMSELGG